MNFVMLSKLLMAFLSISLFYVGSAQQQPSFSALFAFGDSILDTGNNVGLLGAVAGIVYPYGIDFPTHLPTGRFGNGRVFSDIVAEELGIKSILPAYRSPFTTNNDLLTGVCFASGGSGLDQITIGLTHAIWTPAQLGDFQNTITRINGAVGGDQAKTNQIISNAVYLISAGNNDIAIGYILAGRTLQISPMAYTDQLVSLTNNFIKGLYDMGARKFAVMGTLPLGCLPGARASNPLTCELFANSVAKMFNDKLSANVNNLGAQFPGAKFAYVDMYNSLYGVINNPAAAGFIDAKDPCCPVPGIPPCPDASRFVFWDTAHPSQKSYQTIAPSLVQNIKQQLA